ncbi:MAG TPA: nitroreductase family protein [Flavobacteriales bacterium]|jgi:iodotyrosine deiodinase|nr:nitroreductase family protein [Flavobacteriales bacterium]
MGTPADHHPLTFAYFSSSEMEARAMEFHRLMDARRSVRHFSPEQVPFAVIAEVVRAASTAPSGAHKQPWTFCVVGNADLKRRIRAAAEEEERANYNGRMSDEWLKDLAPLGTDADKPFLEDAPWLVVVFKRVYEVEPEGHKHQNYYVNESVGIATGLLLAAAHHAGLATLTHTPSPMNFLTNLLDRPVNERPYLLIPMGYPAPGCLVPRLRRKPLEDVLVSFL